MSDKKDTIDFMSEDGELDVTGWDIKKCLKLMWKSNGALLERVQSPVIYRPASNTAVYAPYHNSQLNSGCLRGLSSGLGANDI